MADVKVKVVKTKKTVVKVEKKISEYQYIRIISTITDKSGLTGISLELVTGSYKGNMKITLQKNRLDCLRFLGVAVSETLEELEKILPAE